MERKIKLTQDKEDNFIAITSQCDFDIDISYNSYIVDAKSIVGVLGLDLNQVLTVSYNGFNSEFEEFMNRFAIAC